MQYQSITAETFQLGTLSLYLFVYMVEKDFLVSFIDVLSHYIEHIWHYINKNFESILCLDV